MKKRNSKQTIKTQYNNFHEVYTDNFSEDKISNAFFHKSIDFNLEGKNLLDIGCGDAVDLSILSQKGAKVYGLDPSIEFLKKAQSNNPEGIFTEGVGEKIPFKDATFDVVTSKWAMQTSTNVPKVLSEMARVLKKDGMLVFLTKHPFLQFLQKIRDNGHGVDYYKQQVVTSNIYSGKIKLHEPSHTMGEYFNQEFYSNFEVLSYHEGSDFPASEQLNGDVYPTYMIIVARKK
jgi:ubiquinone/menaquinone biosynthesis C-methylase UbiE